MSRLARQVGFGEHTLTPRVPPRLEPPIRLGSNAKTQYRLLCAITGWGVRIFGLLRSPRVGWASRVTFRVVRDARTGRQLEQKVVSAPEFCSTAFQPQCPSIRWALPRPSSSHTRVNVGHCKDGEQSREVPDRACAPTSAHQSLPNALQTSKKPQGNMHARTPVAADRLRRAQPQGPPERRAVTVGKRITQWLIFHTCQIKMQVENVAMQRSIGASTRGKSAEGRTRAPMRAPTSPPILGGCRSPVAAVSIPR